ncbi:MAG TPA: alginate export family protein [Bryobacteraceae bacterium]|nr:alginate export family protein [Bryobacteraceae bacterium]
MRAIVCLLLASACASAQALPGAPAAPPPDPAPASATSSSAPIQLGPVAFSGSLRTRFYAWDWFKPAAGENQYEYSGNLLRLNFSEKLNSWDWDAEFAVPFLLGLPTGATDPAPQGALGLGSNYYSSNASRRNTAMIFPKQLYVRFDGLAGEDGQTLRIGRFTFLDGSETAPKNSTLATLKSSRIAQRLLGDFGFTDVGRSFDGLHYSLSSPSSNLTFIAAVPTRGVFQVDGWGWNRVGFGYAAYTKEWGKGRHSADTRFFAIDYDDFRHGVLKTDNRPAAQRRVDTDNIHVQTFGGHSIHAFAAAAGTLDAVAWGAVQTGWWGTQVQRAFAFDFEGGFQPKILPQVKPWVRGGYTYGSGDSNPNDKTHGTFFQILPTPRPYARFPFFNMMNTQDAFGALILRPHSKVTLSSEYHSLRLADASDLWYSGGGVYQPWSFGYTGRSTAGRRSLANLYDANVECRASRNVTLTAYLGYAQGLAAMEQIYTQDKDGRFGYLEMMFRF